MASHPQPFTPDKASRCERQAHAAEYVALRIDKIEMDLAAIVPALDRIVLELKSLASKP